MISLMGQVTNRSIDRNRWSVDFDISMTIKRSTKISKRPIYGMKYIFFVYAALLKMEILYGIY